MKKIPLNAVQSSQLSLFSTFQNQNFQEKRSRQNGNLALKPEILENKETKLADFASVLRQEFAARSKSLSQYEISEREAINSLHGFWA